MKAELLREYIYKWHWNPFLYRTASEVAIKNQAQEMFPNLDELVAKVDDEWDLDCDVNELIENALQP